MRDWRCNWKRKKTVLSFIALSPGRFFSNGEVAIEAVDEVQKDLNVANAHHGVDVM